MTRLETISSYIDENEKVIDVGCDMALLSEILAYRGIYSIASDIRDHIIKKAKNRIDEKLKKFITFRVGSGITLKDDETDYTLVLSGMGTHLIIEILNSTNKEFNKMIIVSNNNYDILRRELLSLGYISVKEEIIKEKNKYYNLIIFKKGNYKYTKEEEYLGVNHQNIILFKEKNKYLLNKYSNILKNIPDNIDTSILKSKIEILKRNI